MVRCVIYIDDLLLKHQNRQACGVKQYWCWAFFESTGFPNQLPQITGGIIVVGPITGHSFVSQMLFPHVGGRGRKTSGEKGLVSLGHILLQRRMQ